jgi:hypothetical protein
MSSSFLCMDALVRKVINDQPIQKLLKVIVDTIDKVSGYANDIVIIIK